MSAIKVGFSVPFPACSSILQLCVLFLGFLLSDFVRVTI